jgi:polyferredoxin
MSITEIIGAAKKRFFGRKTPPLRLKSDWLLLAVIIHWEPIFVLSAKSLGFVPADPGSQAGQKEL